MPVRPVFSAGLPGALVFSLLVTVAQPVLADALTFEYALKLAEAIAPENLARSAQVESAIAAIRPADALPDPKLFLGIDNLPVEGQQRYSLDDDSMTMRRIGFMQEVPNGDKRRARRHSAEAFADLAQAEQRQVLIRVKQDVAASWLRLFYAQNRFSAFDELLKQLALQRSTLPAQISGGTAKPADALELEQEVLDLEDRRDQLISDVAAARAQLRQFLGTQGDQPLSGLPPVWQWSANHSQHGLAHHPDIQAAVARVGEAKAELGEAIAEKKPDWGWELGYGNRDKRFGDMVSLQVTFDLPLFTGARQGPRIASRQKNLSRMEQEQEAMLRNHQAELESGLAEQDRLHAALRRSTADYMPLAQRKLSLAMATYKAGGAAVGTVISARRQLVEATLRKVGLEEELSILTSKLFFAYAEGAQ
ncbi:TolC family protein [Pseudomonas alliivorans]|uniref:TolC family protein n=1 Tax=Pseudomonas cannabina pv. alisalensis TaxID=757414 RepID=A0ABS1X7U4_PSEC1|nr:TolC family protein [Pseudomonas cannabina]MEE4964496.1 TolC family protein [Pseudomonas alliivorans]MBM0137556.1 TolC family protein [Pseudomonas cannabina pv. alisalensis]MEE4974579.1 TolC family protein [Pseudomonas alliivorans]MEE4979728.1 TolC family protein [Pseudomonas alliivorans]MEE4984819.1 TolC family protein [Pseudomonas alliivorans]